MQLNIRNPKLASLFLLTAVALSAQGPTVYRVATAAGTAVAPGTPVDTANLSLNTPIGIARDPRGNLYIADFGNHRIWKSTPDGRSTVIAGTGVLGFTGSDGPATAAQITFPRALAVDGEKYLYFSENSIQRIRRIDLATGVITHVMGTGESTFNGDGRSGIATSLGEVLGLAVDPQGNLLVAEKNRIRRLSADGRTVSTFAGNGTAGAWAEGATATQTAINAPGALALDANGDLYFSDIGLGRIGRIRNGQISTVAGGAQTTALAGAALQVSIRICIGLALSPGSGLLYFTEETTNSVRALNLSTQQVTLVAGTGARGFSGDNGPASQATFNTPNHIVIDNNTLLIADANNQRIRRVIPGGNVTTIAGGRVPAIGDGGPATSALLSNPVSSRLDPNGNLIIADKGNCLVRRVDSSGRISTVAGTAGSCLLPNLITATADAQGTIYWLTSQGLFVRSITDPPQGRRRSTFVFEDILISKDGTRCFLLVNSGDFALVVADTPAYCNSTGDLSRIVSSAGAFRGQGVATGSGPIFDNFLFIPKALADDAQGNLYVLDVGNRNVRKVDFKAGTYSTVVAGSFLANAAGLALDRTDKPILSIGNQVLRFGPDGNPDAGVGSGTAGLSADGVDGFLATLSGPAGLSVGPDNTVYVAESANNLVRRFTPITIDSVEALSTTSVRATLATVRVLLTGSDRKPVGGAGVQFTSSAGAASLSAPGGTSNKDGIAGVNVTLSGSPITVTATVRGLPPVRIDVSPAGSGSNRPSISAALSLSGFGGSKSIAPGGWVEIYGTNFTTETRQWSGADFQNNAAPTSLGGVRVLMNGIPAFVQLISAGQINCVAPEGLGSGEVSVVVSNASGASEALRVPAAARAPGLLAPASFLVDGRQYVAALHTDQSFVGPEGLIAGAPFRPASAGDRLLLYGVGFGATTPAVPAGSITTQAATLPNVEVKLNGTPVSVEYAGLAGGFVGLYQFNLVVPEGVTGAARLTVSVDGLALPQELWLGTK